jgi:catechol-2,3-dioxygenase
MTARAQPRTMPAMTIETIHPAVRVGHVHLRVSDLDRAIAFYRDVLGFEVRLDLRDVGIPAVFLAAGDYHHHVALNTFESEGGTPAPAGHTGLFHVAFLYPTAANWGARCSACSIAGTQSTTSPTTASPSASTCAIPMATASSSATTARAASGSVPTAATSS